MLLLSFVANSVGALVEDLAVLQDVSPWGWYGSGAALTEGFDATSWLLFVATAVVAAVGFVLFERRDLQL